jgi:predicted Rossmann-fold nucleotide-binding protein
MKIGIIGPNKIYDTDVVERKRLLDRVAKIIAKSGDEIVLTADKDSLLEYFGNRYTEFGGKKVWLVIPTQDESHEVYLNTKMGEIIDCRDWDIQANEFNRQSDAYVCVGYAWGAMKEIACAQYFNKKPIYILKQFISSELPKEVNFLVEYIDIQDLASACSRLR